MGPAYGPYPGRARGAGRGDGAKAFARHRLRRVWPHHRPCRPGSERARRNAVGRNRIDGDIRCGRRLCCRCLDRLPPSRQASRTQRLDLELATNAFFVLRVHRRGLQGLMSKPIRFRKMNGLGNDFVVLDTRARPLALSAANVAAIANRRDGIGCDQVIALEPSVYGDVLMRIWNADGEEVGACGNAARCVAALLVSERGSPHVAIETESGLLQATLNKDRSVTIDMGAPRFNWDEIPLSAPFADTRQIKLPTGGIN